MSATAETAERTIEDALQTVQTEERKLRAALDAMRSAGHSNGGGMQRGRRPKAETVTREARRTRQSGETRREQTLTLLRKNKSGMSAGQIAEALGIASQQVYSILRPMVAEETIVKDGKTYKMPDRKVDGVTKGVLSELDAQ